MPPSENFRREHFSSCRLRPPVSDFENPTNNQRLATAGTFSSHLFRGRSLPDTLSEYGPSLPPLKIRMPAAERTGSAGWTAGWR